MLLLVPLFLAAACASPMKEFAEKSFSGSCPEEYARFSKDHSGCKEPNPSCELYNVGLDGQKEIDEILEAHNNLRSQAAMGRESRGGGLPQASNMLQMVWDKQLAFVAQKWTQNCVYDHDCNECREVENFRVGQNMARSDTSCIGTKCKKTPFTDVIKSWYNEVEDYDKRNLTSFRADKIKKTGHFTQVVWAESWRVGCGYASFKNGGGTRHMYTCNYGIAGNMRDDSVYKQGKPCSECPINSCCGSECRSGKSYAGLCNVTNTRIGPIYPQINDNTIFHCNFSRGNPACDNMTSGVENWVRKDTLSGNILSIKLRGGQQSQLNFRTAVHPKTGICIRVQYRKGPARAGHAEANAFELIVEHSLGPSVVRKLGTFSQFSWYGLGFFKVPMLRLGIKFSVPSDMPEQILDVKHIAVLEGSCP